MPEELVFSGLTVTNTQSDYKSNRKLSSNADSEGSRHARKKPTYEDIPKKCSLNKSFNDLYVLTPIIKNSHHLQEQRCLRSSRRRLLNSLKKISLASYNKAICAYQKTGSKQVIAIGLETENTGVVMEDSIALYTRKDVN